MTALSSDGKQDNLTSRAIKTVYSQYNALYDASRVHLRLVMKTEPEGGVRDAFAAFVSSTSSLLERIFQMLLAVQTPSHASDEDSEDDEIDQDPDERCKVRYHKPEPQHIRRKRERHYRTWIGQFLLLIQRYDSLSHERCNIRKSTFLKIHA